jgi:hypothetical protein
MSRRTNGKPPLGRPRVILGSRACEASRRRGTLIGLAGRALYVAGRDMAAATLREALLAAAARDHLPLLRRFADFWPSGRDTACIVGDPLRDWPSARIPPEKRRRHGG